MGERGGREGQVRGSEVALRETPPPPGATRAVKFSNSSIGFH